MRSIQMVDLQSQYQKIKPEVDEAIQSVIDSARFIKGPEVNEFAENLAKYTGSNFIIPCANGTDALQIAMMALDLKPGDEVITATFTYAATAEVIALMGLTPVLVEVNPNTFCIDPDAFEKAITPKTKAVVPVHLFGQCADMERILPVAEKHGLYVIEDLAQAIGSVYTFNNGTKKQAGTMGHIGTTSFFPSKNLGCYGDGGALFAQDPLIAEKIKMIANHGQKVQYYHDIIGVNSRLDTLQAAILNIKLKYLDQYCKARQDVADYYDKALAGHPNFKIPSRDLKSTHVFHQYTLQLCGLDRNALKTHLAKLGIPSMVYYPLPLHYQKAFESDRFPKGSFPISESLCETVLSLPISTEMDKEQLSFIVEALLKYAAENSLEKSI
ncbi:MAG: DegT/DnrJ/EryC1/StrS family aminotransferase [Flavobacteriales bacterium]|nr:DegT/DnrJ/EryC1/StrS family aminotransferase [Flavobacteriales bacterium]